MKVWNATITLLLGAILCSTFVFQHAEARGLLGAVVNEVEEAQQHENNQEEGVFAVDKKEEESFHAAGPRRRLAHNAVERDLWWKKYSSPSGKVMQRYPVMRTVRDRVALHSPPSVCLALKRRGL